MDRVVHFEIPAKNLKRAQEFYKTAFGWQINSYPGMDYTLVVTGPTDAKKYKLKETGFINGGMLKSQAPVRSPVITINVASIDAAAKKIEKLGGKIVRKKMRVGKMGFAAYFKDSEENILGLWETA